MPGVTEKRLTESPDVMYSGTPGLTCARMRTAQNLTSSMVISKTGSAMRSTHIETRGCNQPIPAVNLQPAQ